MKSVNPEGTYQIGYASCRLFKDEFEVVLITY